MKLGDNPRALHEIYTHQDVDLDAALSTGAALWLMDTESSATIVFVPANWMPGDDVDLDRCAIVDMDAGGHGIKGRRDPDGTVHSCFAAIVERYASPDDQRALAPLVAFVDAQDISGHAMRHLAPSLDRSMQDTLLGASIVEVLWGLKLWEQNNDRAVISTMHLLLNALLEQGRARVASQREADHVELFADGKVALLRDPKYPSTSRVLFDRGVQVIVYQDGFNLGLNRNPEFRKLRMDDPNIAAVILDAGETIGNGGNTWFAHSAGFLLCRGSSVAPAREPSKVRPLDLVTAVVELVS